MPYDTLQHYFRLFATPWHMLTIPLFRLPDSCYTGEDREEVVVRYSSASSRAHHQALKHTCLMQISYSSGLSWESAVDSRALFHTAPDHYRFSVQRRRTR